MVETITATASPALDHIIERPRLIAQLEEGGGARVSVLAAPAGYGETTLAGPGAEAQAGARVVAAAGRPGRVVPHYPRLGRRRPAGGAAGRAPRVDRPGAAAR